MGFTKRKVAGGFFIFWLLVIMFACSFGLSKAHAAVAVKHQDNSLGAIMYTDNPNTYLMGLVTNVSVHGSDGQVYTTVRIRPTNTYGLYYDEPTFCGNEYRMVTETKGVVVFTYSKVQHRRWCYDLYRVDKVEGSEP